MISIIVAVTKNNVIGNKGIMPWTIKGEQIRFKELTTGHTIIVGRKTYEAEGKPLPNRKTIVVSTTKNIEGKNCITVKSLEEALELAESEKEIFIAGGGEIYRQALPMTDRIYITIIDKVIEGDVYFPKINEKEFVKTYEERIEGEIPYTYYTYERKRD